MNISYTAASCLRSASPSLLSPHPKASKCDTVQYQSGSRCGPLISLPIEGLGYSLESSSRGSTMYRRSRRITLSQYTTLHAFQSVASVSFKLARASTSFLKGKCIWIDRPVLQINSMLFRPRLDLCFIYNHLRTTSFLVIQDVHRLKCGDYVVGHDVCFFAKIEDGERFLGGMCE